MKTSIILTIIAEDHPGIIEAISRVIKNHDGNWIQSSMSSLAGQFAGVLLASVPGDKLDACRLELNALEFEGLRVIIRTGSGEAPAEDAEEFSIRLVGNDRPGIVHNISRILAAHKVRVIDLETSVEAASTGGADIFRASAQLLVPASSDIFSLESELEVIGNDLMVDISFEK